ncbi:MAG TPA: type II toxin-antitoxin system PemK/MazF family toxin [Thermoanaerobaculales bacterium]|nr:type II toxin-antitoxin system PemK/MazF family toxin [Thermoanaerobaculales bacterium]HPA82790.1 type II toxin-antitoxin system PemK/MazF family toxin [Thermoanaerobaculales bacterium]HQN96514.1 type II toxin-antitoxin system PemK/MazF family toxin [Thermoanaerobaculales bacterium]HQP44914.1 type II toxin-antitoxin system PemK/MazF family toxin [Thermoanaerobaculales bacterium]
MARRLSRGDIWMYEFEAPDKRRPVVILSRQAVIPLLRTVMVAPITSAVHGVPSEVLVGPEHGLKRASAINLDHVQTVDKQRLRLFVDHLGAGVMAEVCRALAAATGCL